MTSPAILTCPACEGVGAPGAGDPLHAVLHRRYPAVVTHGGRTVALADPDHVVTGEAVWDALAGIALAPPASTRGSWVVALLPYDLATSVERLPAPLPDPGGPPRAWLGRYPAGRVTRAAAPGPPADLPGGAPPWTTSLPPDAYRARVDAVRDLIRAGDCYQVNLTQRLTAPWPGDAAAFASRLWAATGVTSHRAFLALDEGTLVSGSPERLVRTRDGVAESEPIKGTAAPCAWESLAASAKDRAEHVMIVDLVRNDLGRVAVPGGVDVPLLMVRLTTPYVEHMVSRVRARLAPGTSAADLLRAVFPGGSVTGCPKVRAMEVIRDLEPAGRGPAYGSLVVIAPDGSLDASVLIRTAWLTAGEVRYWSGGAVTWDSDPDAEHREAMAKAAPFLVALGHDAG